MKWLITLVILEIPDIKSEKIVEEHSRSLPLKGIKAELDGKEKDVSNGFIHPISCTIYEIKNIFYNYNLKPKTPEKVTIGKIKIEIYEHEDIFFEVNREMTKEELSKIKLIFAPIN